MKVIAKKKITVRSVAQCPIKNHREKLIKAQNNIAVDRASSMTLNLLMHFCLQNVLLPPAITEKQMLNM